MSELAVAMQAESAAVRWQAIVQLNEATGAAADDPALLPILVKALADDHPFVRWQAGLALAQQGYGRQKLVDVLRSDTALPAELLAGSARPRVNFLRSAAIDALATHKLPEVKAILLRSLQAEEALLRQSAAEALAYHGDAETIPALIVAIKDTNPWVRRAAVYALGRLGDTHVATSLAECLSDQAVVVRRSAAYALGALRARAAGESLRAALADPDPQVRRNAAWALGRLGLPDTVPDLKNLLNDTALEGTVALTASQAIETIIRPHWLQLLLGVRGRLKQ